MLSAVLFDGIGSLVIAALVAGFVLNRKGGMLLGGHVTEEYHQSAEAHTLWRTFLLAAVAVGLLSSAMAIMLSLSGHLALAGALIPTEVIVLLLLRMWGWQKVRPHAALPAPRVGTLATAMGTGYLVAIAAALFPLAGTAVLLRARWSELPARLPVHYDAAGHVNRWAARSDASVFGPLVFGAVLIGLMELLAWLTPRSSAGHQGRGELLRFTQVTLAGSAWLIAAVFSIVALMPLIHAPAAMIAIVVALPLVLLAFLAFGPILRMMRQPDVLAQVQGATDDRYWKGGLWYVNRQDPALMVPKRDGLGYTINLGRPAGVLLLASILLIPLLSILMTHHAR